MLKVRENMTTRRSSSSGGDVRVVTPKVVESDAQDATRGISTDPAGMKSALLVSPFAEDHQLLSQIFLDKGWPLRLAYTLGSALAVLRERPIPVVIAERALPCGDWKDLFAALQLLPHRPLLVVTSQLADEELWAEVLNLGGHDVLAKPFQAAEVLWVLEGAWRIWANRNKAAANTLEAAMGSGAA
jgi:DNA-binding response OmpR family regulator